MELKCLESIIFFLADKIWTIPFLLMILFTAIVFSFAFNFIQVRNFFYAWRIIFSEEKEEKENKDNSKNKISTFQAFINALSSSIGNGGISGMTVVLLDGGPGAVFWVFILGFFSMILRFVEVYATLVLKSEKKEGSDLIGPLKYISLLPFGSLFVYIYSFFMFLYIIFGGIALQCNTMGLALTKLTNILPQTIAIIFSLFVLYIIIGGSKRIMRISEIVTPIKVGAFFISIFLILIYNFSNIPEAINLIIKCAFNFKSFAIGTSVFTFQKTISTTLSKTFNATEIGSGTAAIFFDSTEEKDRIKSATSSMLTAFISTDLVCGLLLFVLVLTGMINSSLQSSQLLIASFEGTFGYFSSYIVTFLSFSFGLGVMISYSFLGQKMWEFIFGKGFSIIYRIILISMAYLGTLSQVTIVWKALDILSGVLIFINILGLIYILPKIRKAYLDEVKKV